MRISIAADVDDMGRRAAACGAERIRAAIAERDSAKIIVATGASQFTVLDSLAAADDIAWHRVQVFHLDEYIGLDESHPASFRRYLRQRFIDKVSPAAFHAIDGQVEPPQRECQRLGELIHQHPIDVALVGIGENGHLAFNDPPADFKTDEPYLVVELDEACRRQQSGEGWFPSLDDVPRQAISMSVRQILSSNSIVCSVPDERKSQAVQQSLEGPVTPEVPASILQNHNDCHILLDEPAASRLSETTLALSEP